MSKVGRPSVCVPPQALLTGPRERDDRVVGARPTFRSLLRLGWLFMDLSAVKCCFLTFRALAFR